MNDGTIINLKIYLTCIKKLKLTLLVQNPQAKIDLHCLNSFTTVEVTSF